MKLNMQELVKHYLQHMTLYSEEGVSTTGGIMLSSSAGVGKTTCIKKIAKLLGLGIVVIEAPHIVEETIINIPFIVKLPTSENTKKVNLSVNLNSLFVILIYMT